MHKNKSLPLQQKKTIRSSFNSSHSSGMDFSTLNHKHKRKTVNFHLHEETINVQTNSSKSSIENSVITEQTSQVDTTPALTPTDFEENKKFLGEKKESKTS